jgi:hypothetical protein
MANKLANGSSLAAIINDAERSGASAEKARQIYDLVEANASSEFLRRFEIEFGPDSTDSPAVWVHLIVDADLRPSKQKMAKLGSWCERYELRYCAKIWVSGPMSMLEGVLDAAP